MKKKFFAVAAVAMALVMGIAGCADKKDDKKDDNKTESTEEAQATEESEEEILAKMVSLEDTKEALVKDIDTLVKLGEYKGIEVEITETKVTDEQVEKQIQDNLKSAGEYEQIKEGTVADGNTVNIDYVGTIDGEEFSGGSAEGANLDIGSNSYIDGFEEGLIGANVGDEVELNLTFPDDYTNTELAGKAVVFKVTINYIQGELVPAQLTDDWVAEQSIENVATVDEYKAYVKSDLEEQAKDKDEQAVYEAIMEKIIASATITGLSEDLDKEERTESEVSTMEEYASYYGVTVDDLVKESMGMTYDEYLEQLSQDIDNYFDRIMIYRAVINAENLEVTEDEYKEAVLGYAENYSYYGYESASAFVEENSKDICEGLFNTKAEEFLIDNAKVTKK